MLKYHNCTVFLNRFDLLLASRCPGTSAIQVRGRRRTLTPPPWVPQKENNITKILSNEERKHLEGQLHQEPSFLAKRIRPTIKFNKDEQVWSPLSKRFGLIGRKIGMAPQWLTDGTRILCTLVEIPENHVINAIDPATWFKNSIVGKRKAYTRFGPRWKVTIGAVNSNPTFYTADYQRMFKKIGVPVKDFLGGFLTTKDAVVSPGTKLDVRHFSIGQFVNVTGKTIDWGFQGVVHRWGMKGLPQRNTTKAHRRVGSIGSKGDAKVHLGKRLPGHMGYDWKTVRGLEIVRINPIKQVLYLKGAIPGDIGELVLLKDMLVGKKKVTNPPFPTYFMVKESNSTEENAQKLIATEIISKDIYSPKLFNFTSPSLEFTELDEVKTTARDRTKAKLAKVRK